MFKNTLKINLTIPLVVPVMTDIAGRRRSITDHVANYINEYAFDACFSNYLKMMDRELSDGATDSEMDLYERITSEETGKILAESDTRRIEFDKVKDEECLRLYGCSWSDFRRLKWHEQETLREENGVYWDGKGWIKK